MVVAVVLLFSFPDFLQSLDLGFGGSWIPALPLQEYQLAWVVPSLVTYGIGILGWRTGLFQSKEEHSGK
jgi:branched-subunit amino acid permease